MISFTPCDCMKACDLGVAGRIVVLDHLVASCADDFLTAHQHGSIGMSPLGLGGFRLRYGRLQLPFKPVQEASWADDRWLRLAKSSEMRIAGNQEVCFTRASQGNQVIIPRIG